jgi:hypothetical protein
MGQRIVEESLAGWKTCIGNLLSGFRSYWGTGIQRWEVCFLAREIMTTLEMSLGVLEGPARSAFRENLGEPVQLGNRKRSNGWAVAVMFPPCSRE